MSNHVHAQVKPTSSPAPSFTPAPSRLLQRKCACGGAPGVDGMCEACRQKRLSGVQTKLVVNKPGDRYEQEADRIADQVMRMPDPTVQRQEVSEEEEEDETLQMKPLSAQITPLVQRETINEEEDEEVTPANAGGGQGLLSMRNLEYREHNLPSDESDALPSEESKVRPPPLRLDPEQKWALVNEMEDADARRQWQRDQDAKVTRENRPPNLGIEYVLQEVEKVIKEKPLLKHIFNTVKNSIKIMLKAGTQGDKSKEKPSKDLHKLDKQLQEQEELMNIPDKKKEEWEKKKGKVVQRQPLNEEDEEELLLAKGADAQVPTVTPSVEAAVQSVRQDGGQPLAPATRAFMEPRFGHNFRHVRVHTGPQAAEAAQAVRARAFTIGPDVVFGQGQYTPKTRAGQRLLAHELTHVVQQSVLGPQDSIQRRIQQKRSGKNGLGHRFGQTSLEG